MGLLMSGMETILLPQALCDPAIYPHQPTSVELKETHISWIFLTGDFVYKGKKPVKFDFLDFSTLELRKLACEDEVRLNRRLAPDAYLGVVPVTLAGGQVQIGGSGPAVEWLVHMRRFPVEEALDQRFWRGDLQECEIARLAQTLTAFYQQLQPADISAAQYRSRFVQHVQQNRVELLAAAHHLPAEQIQRIHAAQLQLLHLQPELFAARVAAGCVVEGHGDLRPEHICLTDPPIIFDCIEFSREFRTLDVADEMAFLASECDHLGASWVGRELIAQISRSLPEPIPPGLLDFYKSYRACVRAKVAALRADQLTGIQQDAAICQARNYLLQAENYLQPWQQPLLIVVGGLAGTGKSTLARQLGNELGADVLRTDVIRKQLFDQAGPADVGSGVYQTESRNRVYEELLQTAAERLQLGNSVILDGTFGNSQWLAAAQAQAQKSNARFLAVECTCPASIAKARIETRLQSRQDASDANASVHDEQRRCWQPWPTAIRQCQVDTTEPVEKQLGTIFPRVRRKRDCFRRSLSPE